jgi:hypothetical protein
MNESQAPRRVGSLRELPHAIEPGRDLWPGIEAQLAERAGAAAPVRRRGGLPLAWLAAAAMVGSLAVGVWIGRSVLPGARPAPPLAAAPAAAAPQQVAWVSDPRYQRQRAALLATFDQQLAALPPPSRAKVLASLATIRHAQQDLEQALGKDPANALLQELLVNTYQDEMRVLTDVREASEAGRGI